MLQNITSYPSIYGSVLAVTHIQLSSSTARGGVTKPSGRSNYKCLHHSIPLLPTAVYLLSMHTYVASVLFAKCVFNHDPLNFAHIANVCAANHLLKCPGLNRVSTLWNLNKWFKKQISKTRSDLKSLCQSVTFMKNKKT